MSDHASQPLGWIKFWKPKDDWYYLAPSERQSYLDDFARVVDQTTQKGGRLIGTYKCRGQSIWARFEVWEFPDVQTLIDFSNELEEIGHFQYFAEDHTVGRRYERAGQADSWII